MIVKECRTCIHYEDGLCIRVGHFINECHNCKKWKGKTMEEIVTKDDPVNHPSHYTSGKIEVIDYIEDQGFNFNLGNAVKYISRAGKKDPNKTVEDLQKAIFYINREIKRLG